MTRLAAALILIAAALCCGCVSTPPPPPAGNPGIAIVPRGSLRPDADGRSRIAFAYHRGADTTVEKLDFRLRGADRVYELDACVRPAILDSLNAREQGEVAFPLVTRYLPAGRYDVTVAPRMIGGGGDGVLTGNGMIYTPADLTAGDFTLSYRFFSLRGGQHVFFRCPDRIVNGTQTWNFYYVEFFNHRPMCIRRAANTPKGKMWDVISNTVPVTIDDGRWHELKITMRGGRIVAVLDGEHRVEANEPEPLYSGGGIGFWQGIEGCVMDDLRLTDAAGQTIFADDFSGGELSDAWQVGFGEWAVTDGRIDQAPPTILGELVIPERRAGFPRAVLEPVADGVALMIDGRREVPMILAFSTLAKGHGLPASYALPRRAADAGMPILSPVLGNVIDVRPDGSLDFSTFDSVMTRLATVCPDAWLLPRLSLPDPPTIPTAERIHMAYGTGQPIDPTSAGVALRRFRNVSSASRTYREFVLAKTPEIVAHLRAQPYAARFIGACICGAGYEGNWTPPRKPTGTVDASPAMKRLFGAWLRAKYDRAEAVAKAWDLPRVDLDDPPIPTLAMRSGVDFAGFRNPAIGPRRHVLDWEEFYSMHINTDLLWPVFDRLHAAAPDLLWGHFGLYGFPGRPSPMVDHPGQDFIVGCLTYGDRRAGGISLYTNTMWESLRLRDKLALGEADIRTVFGRQDSWYEPTMRDSIQSMRREFAAAIVVQRMAVWYYDMQEGWFDHPELLAEMSRQERLARKLIRLPHENIAELAVCLAERGWRSGDGGRDEPVAPAEPDDRQRHLGAKAHAQFITERIMRVGAPKDVLLTRDLCRDDARDYKAYVFPGHFHARDDFRRKIQDLARRGKTVVLVGGAGIATEDAMGEEHMAELTGMTIAAGEVGGLLARAVESDHPLLRGLAEGTQLGANGIGRRFRVTDPRATPLAVWEDGSVAAAVKPMGKGHVVYTAMPILQPAFYRNVLAFAGGHIYSQAADGFYADNHFIAIHTGSDEATGPREVVLPRRVAVIRDLVSGAVWRDTDRFTIELPARTTGLWYYGGGAADPGGVRLTE